MRSKSKRKTKCKTIVTNGVNGVNGLTRESINGSISDTSDHNETKVAVKSSKEGNTCRTKTTSHNHLITDYYPTLSSGRKRLTSKALELQREKLIKHYLINDCDPKDLLAVEEFGDKGKGVVASRDISKGSFICEYSGDLVDMERAQCQEVSYALVGAGCYMYYFSWKSKTWCIDATKPSGRFGRLINHSRKTPNCKTKLVESNGRPHLVFIALRDINQSEEILYDYGETDKNAIREHPWLAST
ncbi:unnamed protein product [Medioppia subpectinata]|uniref:SET domain-containing protein n=1 Tax=Medioppia subpectinata TaxID=1979941 RepID=A0A7R9Q6U7_9ACAR|nr:unnamed protein product [Medioppia subpectinata]CAG2114098.1 unnamed protein product [Medioppia subpectinata]